jgi:hypothetical protein
VRILKMTTSIAATVVALTISLAGVTTAHAATGPGAEAAGVIAGPRVVAVEAGLDPRLAAATDLELLLFLMTGAGPLADAHPELLAEFGIHSVSPPEQVEQITPVAEAFLAAYPAFSMTWGPAIRSADPLVVTQGTRGFLTDFIEFVESSCRPSCSV